MLEEAHWVLLREAADRPHVQCRLYGALYGRPGAVDWPGTERHRRCQELAAQGYLRAAGVTGTPQSPGGQWSRWAITEPGIAALGRLDRSDAAPGEGQSPSGPRD